MGLARATNCGGIGWGGSKDDAQGLALDQVLCAGVLSCDCLGSGWFLCAKPPTIRDLQIVRIRAAFVICEGAVLACVVIL